MSDLVLCIRSQGFPATYIFSPKKLKELALTSKAWLDVVHKSKGRRFDSGSGDMAEFRAMSPVRGVQGTTSISVSLLFLSPFPSL